MTLDLTLIRHMLIDLDGVLYRGNMPLRGSGEFITWLRGRRIGFRLVTNNATLTPEAYREKLAGMGIEVAVEEIFTSSLATALYLQREGQSGRSAYVVGETGIREALEQIGMQMTESRPDWVVVGLDRGLTYEKLAVATLAIRGGARFLGTNPDTSFPSERGLVPGAGAILAALTAATGVAPVVVGKPEPLMLELAMRAAGGTPGDTVMLGDRLDTDIAAADRVGVPSILVLTGVSTRDDLASSPYRPARVFEDLDELLRTWQAERRKHV